MIKAVFLDAGPLGLVTKRRGQSPEVDACRAWMRGLVVAGMQVCVAEVTDYEVRRELIRLSRAGQMPLSRLTRLDHLANLCSFLPVSTAMWRRAAGFWADARQHGLPTASSVALDADVIIAAQAAEVFATVVTNNPGHISRWVPVRAWP